MAIALICLAAFFLSMTNLCMRRSMDAGGSAKGFLVLQFLLSFLVAILMNPVRTQSYGWDSLIGLSGLLGGLFMGGMMLCIGKALEKGPPGLSFATMNAASVMPALIMAAIFGASFAHPLELHHLIGSTSVVLGLFWAVRKQSQFSDLKLWLLFAFSAFALHVSLILLLQWRALILKSDLPIHALLPYSVGESHAQWFMPMIFLMGSVMQIANYLRKRGWKPLERKELFLGVLGGSLNGIGTFFSIKSTEIATAFENAMLFPTFSVAIILITNIWGKMLYGEEIHWKSNSLCLLGIVIGTYHWS